MGQAQSQKSRVLHKLLDFMRRKSLAPSSDLTESFVSSSECQTHGRQFLQLWSSLKLAKTLWKQSKHSPSNIFLTLGQKVIRKKGYELTSHQNIKSANRICKIKLSFSWAQIIKFYSEPWDVNIKCSLCIIEREEESKLNWEESFLARLEVTCLAHIPQHEMMAKQRKEGKGATTPVQHRDGSHPCLLPPHSVII